MRQCILQRLYFVVGAMSLVLLFGTVVSASEDHAQMDPAMQAMMAKWQAYATPGKHHEVLSPLVGTWSHIVKWWMKPGTEPEVSKGSSETKWVMGGRFLQHLATGVSMGQPFEGMGLTGFDNKKRKYQTIWMDNMGTGMMIGEGTYNEKQQTLTDQGHFTDPMIGQRGYRGVITFVDEKHHRYEMFGLDNTGKEFRMMEIMYTRTD